MRNRRPLSPLLAAGFQQSLNTYSVLQVQSGSKLNANKCRLKKVFKKKLALTIILPQNNQFPIRTEQSSLFIMDFGVCTSSASIFSVSLCRYVKLSFSDTSQHCSPPTKTGSRHAEAPCPQPFPPMQAGLFPVPLSLCPAGCLHYCRSSTLGQGTGKAQVLRAPTQHWPPAHVQT